MHRPGPAFSLCSDDVTRARGLRCRGRGRCTALRPVMGSALQSGSFLLILSLTPCPLCSVWNYTVLPILMPAVLLAQSLLPDIPLSYTLGPASALILLHFDREVAPKEGPSRLGCGRVGRGHLGWGNRTWWPHIGPQTVAQALRGKMIPWGAGRRQVLSLSF